MVIDTDRPGECDLVASVPSLLHCNDNLIRQVAILVKHGAIDVEGNEPRLGSCCHLTHSCIRSTLGSADNADPTHERLQDFWNQNGTIRLLVGF